MNYLQLLEDVASLDKEFQKLSAFKNLAMRCDDVRWNDKEKLLKRKEISLLGEKLDGLIVRYGYSDKNIHTSCVIVGKLTVVRLISHEQKNQNIKEMHGYEIDLSFQAREYWRLPGLATILVECS